MLEGKASENNAQGLQDKFHFNRFETIATKERKCCKDEKMYFISFIFHFPSYVQVHFISWSQSSLARWKTCLEIFTWECVCVSGSFRNLLHCAASVDLLPNEAHKNINKKFFVDLLEAIGCYTCCLFFIWYFNNQNQCWERCYQVRET